MSRDVAIFGRYWKATTFSSIVQPTIYLLAFGLGFGALVKHHVGHLTYVQYVATGVVATAVLFSSAFPGMFNTFIRWQFQRTYDAMLAAPVDVEELITAEILWISVRAGVYGLAPLLVGIAFGVKPNAGMLLVPLIGFVTGFGFAAFGVTVAAVAKTIDNFNYITSAVLTPLFLVAGTFFPITTLPAGVRAVAQVNPLYHCVQLVRDASLGEFVSSRPRARGRTDRVCAAHVATGDPATGQAPDRLSALMNFEVRQSCSYTRRRCSRMSYSWETHSAASPTASAEPVATPGRSRGVRGCGRGRSRRRRDRSCGVMALAAVLNLWALSRNGWANEYYAAAVRSMSSSWHDFLFASLDKGGVMTVDKPPLALWVQALSVRVFGFHSLSILVPQALMGVASVALVYDLVRRRFGRIGGFVAGLALALTPITVAVSRHNNPDALLVLLCVAALWCTVRALERPHAPAGWWPRACASAWL